MIAILVIVILAITLPLVLLSRSDSLPPDPYSYKEFNFIKLKDSAPITSTVYNVEMTLEQSPYSEYSLIDCQDLSEEDMIELGIESCRLTKFYQRYLTENL